MWILISLAAVAVLFLAALAGFGRFGQMPHQAVNDRPKGHVPDGPVTPELLEQLRIPTVVTGYRPDQVDRYLADIAAGQAAPAEMVKFDVVRRGYDMQVVDHLILRPALFRPSPDTILDDAE